MGNAGRLCDGIEIEGRQRGVLHGFNVFRLKEPNPEGRVREWRNNTAAGHTVLCASH